jgi:hypothetical protein
MTRTTKSQYRNSAIAISLSDFGMLLGVDRILRPRVFGSDFHTKWNGVHHRPFYPAETPAILRTSLETQIRVCQRNTQGNQKESENLQEADSNGDGYVVGSEVMEYVIEHVPQNSAFQNPEQGSIPKPHGDMVFGPVSSQVKNPKPVPPPATKQETIYKEWRSPGLNVDCNRTNSGRIQASVGLDSSLNEKVIGVTAHYEGSDNIKDATGPSVEGVPGPSIVVAYGFNGLDRNFGNCPGGGHTTVVVEFQVQRTVPILEPAAKP